jgi:hypothetical protein
MRVRHSVAKLCTSRVLSDEMNASTNFSAARCLLTCGNKKTLKQGRKSTGYPGMRGETTDQA